MNVEREIPLQCDESPVHEGITLKLGESTLVQPEKSQKETADFLEWLKTIKPWEEEFPDVDEGLLPMEDVE
jgi:antitoxin VapB